MNSGISYGELALFSSENISWTLPKSLSNNDGKVNPNGCEGSGSDPIVVIVVVVNDADSKTLGRITYKYFPLTNINNILVN